MQSTLSPTAWTTVLRRRDHGLRGRRAPSVRERTSDAAEAAGKFVSLLTFLPVLAVQLAGAAALVAVAFVVAPLLVLLPAAVIGGLVQAVTDLLTILGWL